MSNDDTLNSSGGLRYLKACAEATASAGLDVVSAALSHEGIAHVVSQTGGMTMVLYIDDHGERLGVAEGSGAGWSVYRYAKHACDESRSTGACRCDGKDDYEDGIGESVADDASLAEVVTHAKDFIATGRIADVKEGEREQLRAAEAQHAPADPADVI